MSICVVADCLGVSLVNGRCQHHATASDRDISRSRETGRGRKRDDLCCAPNCERKPMETFDAFCSGHQHLTLARPFRSQDLSLYLPQAELQKRRRSHHRQATSSLICNEEGCEDKAKNYGKCFKHYYRDYRRRRAIKKASSPS